MEQMASNEIKKTALLIGKISNMFLPDDPLTAGFRMNQQKKMILILFHFVFNFQPCVCAAVCVRPWVYEPVSELSTGLFPGGRNETQIVSSRRKLIKEDKQRLTNVIKPDDK